MALTTQPAVDLLQLMDAYDTDIECRTYLEGLRWPKGIECPRCQSKSISRIKERKQFDCDSCRYQFSATAGTIFHDSHLPLPKWFLAIFLMSESKKGISALQLKRTLRVSYKTAWYLCHRIREAMKDGKPRLLTGTVEVDETYIGGKRRGVGSGRISRNKRMVLGAVQRGGHIRMAHADHDTKPILHKFIHDNVSKSAKSIYTDGHLSYRGLKGTKATHEWVDHRGNEWVRGDVSTNQVEGAFGLFKRSLVGAFHQVSVKHLDRYLDEFEFRYNNRKNAYLFRDTLTRLVNGSALPYEKLTA
jgi:transposase-like protein